MISVVLATFNEEKNIGDCLRAVEGLADEVIVFDESSGDQTREIAQGLGAKVFKVKHEPIFHITKQKAIDAARGEWVLQLDADERITPQLKEEILKVVSKDKEPSAFWIKRKNYFLGKWMRGGGMWPDSVVRLFRKGKAKLPQKSVHEQMEVDGKIGELTNPMEHYTAPTFSKYLTNANRYTTLTSLEMKKNNVSIGFSSFVFYVLFKPAWVFLTLFIRHNGFRDGLHGFVFDLFSGLHFPIAYFKYWQIKNDPTIKEKLTVWR